MILSLEKLTIFGFNQRILTEDDFHKICDCERITVLEMDVSSSFYMSVAGQAFIVLSKKLKGLKKTFVEFHELAHHFLHGERNTTSAFYFNLLDSKNEFEADALALIALLPISSLSSFDFLEEHPNRYARKLYKDRQRLNFLYGV
jgi:Zn-dependent peptidase ImmA (M78 family)